MTVKYKTNQLKVLNAAKKLIERGWARCAAARDTKGNWCVSEDKKAVSWCTTGAIIRALKDTKLKAQKELWDEVLKSFVVANHLGNKNMTFWNDETGRSKVQVLKAFDNAISYVKTGKTYAKKRAHTGDTPVRKRVSRKLCSN